VAYRSNTGMAWATRSNAPTANALFVIGLLFVRFGNFTVLEMLLCAFTFNGSLRMSRAACERKQRSYGGQG
jgi:hypothetical protein